MASSEKISWVRDNWHTEKETGSPCTTCSRGRKRLRKAAEHGKGKRWEVRFYDTAGTQRRGGRYATEHEAEDAAAEIRRKRTPASEVEADPSRGRITVAAWFVEWWRMQTADESSLRAYRCRVQHIERLIGDRPLNALRPVDLQTEFVTPLAAELAPSYVRQIGSTMRHALDLAVEDGRIPGNPMRSRLIKFPALDRTPVPVWPDRNVSAMALALPLWCAGMVLLGGYAGLRQGEVFGLAVEDIDEAAGLIHVRRQVKRHSNVLVFALPKARRTRSVPLSPALARGLRMHLDAVGARAVTLPWMTPAGKARTHRLLFTDPETRGEAAGPVRRSWFNEAHWKPALAAAGIIRTPEFYRDWDEASADGSHALRHWFAAVSLELGVNPYQLSLYLGHSTPAYTLTTYGHLTDRAGRRTVEDHERDLAGLLDRMYASGQRGVRCDPSQSATTGVEDGGTA
ncbi:tyrosine-type recombinase/integrase [Streptomyces sp. NPDC090085]|uniref:tyrosine-type recombinase/integrase n=1 Tax=Streptomyces sp. NPDC090085 TaxID=3365943 RepID=UPI0038225F53